MTESFFNNKNFKSRKKVMQHCFSIKNFKSHKKVMKSFLGIKNLNPYYPNFKIFHKNLRFGVLLSVDNYFTFKNSKKYVLMVPGPKY